MNMITVERRNGKRKARKLRRDGKIPCVIYGGALKESISIQMEKSLANKLTREKREGSKINVKLGDRIIPAQIKEKTSDFVTREISHISFQALKANQKINSVAHILLKNTDRITGILEKQLLEIPYASYPEDMIDTITLDMDGLPVGTVLTLGELADFQSEKIELQTEKSSIVLRIHDINRPLDEADK